MINEMLSRAPSQKLKLMQSARGYEANRLVNRMRNLTPTTFQVADVPPLPSTSHAATLTVDPDDSSIYLARESVSPEGVKVDILHYTYDDGWTSEVSLHYLSGGIWLSLRSSGRC